MSVSLPCDTFIFHSVQFEYNSASFLFFRTLKNFLNTEQTFSFFFKLLCSTVSRVSYAIIYYYSTVYDCTTFAWHAQYFKICVMHETKSYKLHCQQFHLQKCDQTWCNNFAKKRLFLTGNRGKDIQWWEKTLFVFVFKKSAKQKNIGRYVLRI